MWLTPALELMKYLVPLVIATTSSPAPRRQSKRVSHVVALRSFVAGEGGGKGEEGAEVVGVAFVSDGESAVAEQPCDRSFDHPTVFAQLLAGLDAFAGDPDDDAPVADPLPQGGVVIVDQEVR